MWSTPSGVQMPGPESYVSEMMKRPENYRVLERLPLNGESIPARLVGSGKPVRVVAILDTETTGLCPDAEVLELAIVRCGVDDSGRLCSVDEMLDEFNDPGFEIPTEVGRLTGITDEMVSGREIDGAKVGHILRGDPIIIAHNARFDRPFFAKMFKDDYEWACSMQHCNWHSRGFSGKNLACLLQQEGFFFDAHRAYMDCLATAVLLSRVPGSLAEILRPRVIVQANGNTYDKRELLKSCGYWWERNIRVWCKLVAGDADGPDAQHEVEFLKGLFPHASPSLRSMNRRRYFKADPG